MDKSSAEKIMTTTGWLSRQPADFQRDVLGRCVLQRYNTGNLLYGVDDDGSGVFGVVEGVVEVQLKNGQVGTVGTPGYWIGEAAAFRRAPRGAALVARSPVVVCYLPQTQFEALVLDPDYSRCFALLTIEHLEDALRVVASLMSSDVVMRVASRLMNLHTAQPVTGADLTITQTDLASMCGLSRQSVNKALRRLTEEGAISSRYGRVALVDPMKLRQRASEQFR
jgi:CRP-like cAMP-binding protein